MFYIFLMSIFSLATVSSENIISHAVFFSSGDQSSGFADSTDSDVFMAYVVVLMWADDN